MSLHPDRTRAGALVMVASGMVLCAGLLALASASPQPSRAPSVGQAPNPSADLQDGADLALGEEVYRSQCQPCHGDHGKGDGPAARFVDPKPRDLTAGKWQHLEAPTVEQIAKLVSHGIDDTAMEPFDELLTDEEIVAVAAYVLQHFAPRQTGG